MTITRFVPQNARKIEDKLSGSCVYLYESNGRPCVRAFIGKQSKPVFSYYYNTEAQRDARAAEFLKAQHDSAKLKIEWKEARKAAKRSVEVGHVFVSTWGYEQTNVDFYVVTALVGKTMVEIRKCGSITTTNHGMSGRVIPDAEKIVGEAIRCKVNAYGGIKVDGHAANLWEGRPVYFSCYA